VSSHNRHVNIFLWDFLVCPWNTALQMTKINIIYYNFTRLLDKKKPNYWEHDFKNIHVFMVSKSTTKLTTYSLHFITKKRGATSI
jgi:cytochrome c oxidase assembly factor CtaG